MIVPTVGRVLLFYSHPGATERAAIVTAVHNDRCVNLCILHPDGYPISDPPTSVRLLQDDDAVDGGPYCTWMPFQKGQAAKTEKVERDVVDEVNKRMEELFGRLSRLEEWERKYMNDKLLLTAKENDVKPPQPPQPSAN